MLLFRNRQTERNVLVTEFTLIKYKTGFRRCYHPISFSSHANSYFLFFYTVWKCCENFLPLTEPRLTFSDRKSHVFLSCFSKERKIWNEKKNHFLAFIFHMIWNILKFLLIHVTREIIFHKEERFDFWIVQNWFPLEMTFYLPF